jgi:type IV secretory pathway protease TraF
MAQAVPQEVYAMSRAWTWSNKILAVCALVVVGSLPWVKLNLTASAPRGVWAVHPVPPVVERGMWVTLAVPEAVRAFAPRWTTLLKYVAAVEDDVVCVSDRTLWIRGVWYGPVYTQVQGQPILHLGDGCFAVEPGRVFLASQAEKSMDSRYFSSVAITDLRAVATPLLTER